VSELGNRVLLFCTLYGRLSYQSSAPMEHFLPGLGPASAGPIFTVAGTLGMQRTLERLAKVLDKDKIDPLAASFAQPRING
jgi:hypothetical protein